MRFVIVLFGLVMLPIVGNTTPDASALAHAPINFEEVIENAKSQVFPALIYVKPIQEEFTSGEKRKREVYGSGVILSSDGLAVTNNHVAENAIRINCVLSDRQQVPATVVGLDPDTDLALLQLELSPGAPPLPTARWGDSDRVESGQFVMALGSPFGFQRSISLGVVSNAHQYLGSMSDYKYHTWIQTDAAINPGNSGGPLVNTAGEVIGINSVKIPSMMAEGLGFAIPSNVARDVIERLAADGTVHRAWLGVGLQPLIDYESNTITEAETGVLISHVEPNSPAEVAGVNKGDILVSANGETIVGRYTEDLPAIMWILGDLPTDAAVPIEVLRGDTVRELVIEPQPKGEVQGQSFECKRWNMTLREINQFSDPDVYFYRQQGVFVQGVRYPGNAQRAGFRRRDILISVDGSPINSLADIKHIYNDLMADDQRQKKALFEVQRNVLPMWINLDYRRDYDEEY